ncbi:MAG: hypothetical protein A2751_02290 [Candidatus Doudnabacteria bacterium RIFCSPHIGHO2_01_FULL_46_14]|uniref:Uncharacterized protein n=1 Tax=Candidatus Doudnabacteria bacterium RIFCSPHIGHO2_01_FULL_46_14 TaxID=1817824 RepID=A0A1F5NJG6_9BACT|nr:MAG: hypothetical protein A2751_02290 [Candidatus Doudnabacteria bacterium RIFCSPHIGHO2_01_FULL_46_14]
MRIVFLTYNELGGNQTVTDRYEHRFECSWIPNGWTRVGKAGQALVLQYKRSPTDSKETTAMWQELVTKIITEDDYVDHVIAYVCRDERSRDTLALVRHLEPSRVTLVYCPCNREYFAEQVDLAEARHIISECGGCVTMLSLFANYLVAGEVVNVRKQEPEATLPAEQPH